LALRRCAGWLGQDGGGRAIRCVRPQGTALHWIKMGCGPPKSPRPGEQLRVGAQCCKRSCTSKPSAMHQRAGRAATRISENRLGTERRTVYVQAAAGAAVGQAANSRGGWMLSRGAAAPPQQSRRATRATKHEDRGGDPTPHSGVVNRPTPLTVGSDAASAGSAAAAALPRSIPGPAAALSLSCVCSHMPALPVASAKGGVGAAQRPTPVRVAINLPGPWLGVCTTQTCTLLVQWPPLGSSVNQLLP